MDWNLTRWRLGAVLRVVLGGIWLWASWSKLEDPRQFLRAVRAYDATPEWLSKGIAYGLPMLELCLAVLLILGLLTRIAASVSAALFAVFLVGIVQAWTRGLQLDCGCFGGGGLTSDPSYWLDILRDVALLAIAVYLVIWPLTMFSIDGFRIAKHEVPVPSAKTLRTRDGKRKYDTQVAKARDAQRITTLYLTGSLVSLTALVCVIAIAVQSGRAEISGSLEAAHASVSDGVVYGSADAPVTVDIYEDFQCPNCKDFEQEAGEDLNTRVLEGKIKIKYHPMAFLDEASNGNRYSSRAANAALCASDEGVDQFAKFHKYLFGVDIQGEDIQPAEGGSGRTDSSLIAYGTDAGMTTSGFTTCVQGETHKALVEAMTDQASSDGVTGTPTIMVNGDKVGASDGKTLSASVLAAIDEAVTKAADDGKTPVPYTPAPVATPTPTDGSVAADVPATQTLEPTPAGS